MQIIEIQIKSPNLPRQQVFYENILGLKSIEKKTNEVTYAIGNTKLCIKQSTNFYPYHFAINIPCNQTDEALHWLKDRLDVLKCGAHDIQDFNTWNARAMYFYDADHNIVEFIARKNLKNESDKEFSEKSFLQISEIGVPVSVIKNIFDPLYQDYHLELYDGNLERFCAIGDEYGMFICLNKELKKWFPTGDMAYSSDFKIKFKNNGLLHQLDFSEGKIKVSNGQS